MNVCIALVLALLGQPDEPGRLLIVAPARFGAAVAEYAEFKRETRECDVAVLEDVLATTAGVDDPERVKRFLFEAWKQRGVKFVLLVGDADTFPVRYMCLDRVTAAAFDYAFYPSDLYYADVAKRDGSFEDWNGRKDGFHAGYFGEVRGEKNKGDPINFDAIDYRPEIHLGRWPVSDEKQLRVVMGKSVAYERSWHGLPALRTPVECGAGTTDAGEAPKLLAQGETTGVGEAPKPVARQLRCAAIMVGGWVDARGRMDSIVARLPGGWKTDKLYYRDENAAFASPEPNEDRVVGLMNEGMSLVLHTGHGADDRWEGCFSVGSLKKVKNGVTGGAALPVVISAGCSTARFATLPPYEAYVDVLGRPHIGTNGGEVFAAPPPPPSCWATGPYNLTGLGEQMLRAGEGGAVAYIGCNTGSQPCGITLMEGLVAAIATKHTIGECWSAAIEWYWEKEGLETIKPTEDWYPASIFFQGMKFMVFGDPSLSIGEAPKE